VDGKVVILTSFFLHWLLIELILSKMLIYGVINSWF
jgi:hypothetical protein